MDSLERIVGNSINGGSLKGDRIMLQYGNIDSGLRLNDAGYVINHYNGFTGVSVDRGGMVRDSYGRTTGDRLSGPRSYYG